MHNYHNSHNNWVNGLAIIYFKAESIYIKYWYYRTNYCIKMHLQGLMSKHLYTTVHVEVEVRLLC